MKVKGLLIKTDGTQTEVEPADGKRFSLKELQGFVGGYIELVRLPTGMDIWLNEEGKLNDLTFNEKATALANGVIAQSDYIVGDVLFCSQELTKDDDEEDAITLL